MEASALQAPPVLAHSRGRFGASFLRLRSDEQLVALFRAGHDEAFRTIHDRYRDRLFAYTRQMLPRRQDAEDALQDVFLRAYAGLRASDRELALRAWLYRVAHNRCIDELRRALPPPTEQRVEICCPVDDPVAQADQRESIRRLIADIRRLPDQQRSALLMRELGGMAYVDVADALGISIPAVKSLLVRARMALVQALEARDTACSEIRTELLFAHDRRMRPAARARRHMRDCAGCREFRRDLRGVSRQLAALVPALGPLGVLAKLLGLGGGAGSGAAAGGGTAAAGGAVGGSGAAVSAGALGTGVGHVATLLAATVVAAGGAVEIQHTITTPAHVRHHRAAAPASRHPSARSAQFVVAASADAAVAVLPPRTVAPAAPQAATQSASTVSQPRSDTAPAPDRSRSAPAKAGVKSGIEADAQLVGATAPTQINDSNLTGPGNPTANPPGTSTGGNPPPATIGSSTPSVGGSPGVVGGCASTTSATPCAPSTPPSGSSFRGIPSTGGASNPQGVSGGTSGPPSAGQ